MLLHGSKAIPLAKLKAAGLKSKPYTTQKSLEKSLESHIGAVIFERESYARNGSKNDFGMKRERNTNGAGFFDRDVTFVVTIGDYTDEAVESMLEQFVSSLDAGFLVDGNFVPVVVEGADWVDKDDSILKAQVAVQVSITFRGGIYRDTDFGPLSRVELTGLDKKTGKENTDVD